MLSQRHPKYLELEELTIQESTNGEKLTNWIKGGTTYGYQAGAQVGSCLGMTTKYPICVGSIAVFIWAICSSNNSSNGLGNGNCDAFPDAIQDCETEACALTGAAITSIPSIVTSPFALFSKDTLCSDINAKSLKEIKSEAICAPARQTM